jgi:hypothetical protein
MVEIFAGASQMSEWISAKEELPSSQVFVDVSKSYRVIRKVKLTKTKDDSYREGFLYEWKYKSGISAGFLDEDDEWRYIEEPPK